MYFHLRNHCLEKLVFILVNDVEFYLDQEFDRVLTNNGRMSAFMREQRIRQMETEAIAPGHAVVMIEADGVVDCIESWIVQSFRDENIAYAIKVSSATNQILSCACFDFQRRCQPCKHIYLLDLYVSDLTVSTFSTNYVINTTVAEGHVQQKNNNNHLKNHLKRHVVRLLNTIYR
jgi:hypothetical protein